MEGRNLGADRAEAAGHLMAELFIVKDALNSGRITEANAMARIAVIRARARARCSRSFDQLSIQWSSLVSQAENLKLAMILSSDDPSPVC